ncbi:MAG: hypothetical protein HY928_12855 [Elusimicrobia bacterium]|nr:hypothetical protein [Elusimicrobiota bacterium]
MRLRIRFAVWALVMACLWALGSRLGPRGLVSEAALGALRFWDAFHISLDPSLEFSRSTRRADERPLTEQARDMERDLDADFTALGGRLFLIDTPPVQVGDVCLWQGVFAAEAALRAAGGGLPADKGRAARALEGLRHLSSKGRPIARSVYPASLATEPGGGWSFADGRWKWKEDASVDSMAGWVFGVLMVRELVPELRPEADSLILGFAAALKGNGYRLRNGDGTLTRFNRVGGGWVNSPPGVLSTLAVLKAAARADPAGPWGAAHARFVAEGQDRWGAYASGPLLWKNKTTNHNIAFLSLSSALLSEDDPARQTVYARGLVRLHRLVERTGNSFWTYLSLWSLERAGFGEAERDREVALWMARRRLHLARAKVAMLEWQYPACKVKREVVNSSRADLPFSRWPFFGRLALRQPLPLWERPPADFVWQRSAYSLDDWVGYAQEPPQRFSPLDFLVAYRLGLAVGGISPED